MSDTESSEAAPEEEPTEEQPSDSGAKTTEETTQQTTDTKEKTTEDSKESKESSTDSKEQSTDSKDESKDGKEAGGESAESTESKEPAEAKSDEEKKDEKQDQQEELVELKEEEKLEQMENKVCGSMDSSLEEANNCFVSDTENPICCIKIQNPVTEQQAPNERDVLYDSIQKVSKDSDNLSWCAMSESHCVNQLQGKVIWSLEEKEDLIKATRGRHMGEQYNEHQHTPAALPIMIGLTIMLLLTTLYCIYHYAIIKKKQREERYSNRSRKSNRSRGRHKKLVEEV